MSKHIALADVDWGSMPDWLAGIGSLMALIFAFFAVRAAHMTNVQQGRQLKALEEDRRQAQASKVAVWCVGDAGEMPSCLVRNASELPIFGVLVCVIITDMRGPTRGERSVRWWRYQQVEPHVVPPGTIDVRFDRSGLIDDIEMNSRRARAALYFGDANGKWWRRTIGGQLEEQSYDPDLFNLALIDGGGTWTRVPPGSAASDPIDARRLTNRPGAR